MCVKFGNRGFVGSAPGLEQASVQQRQHERSHQVAPGGGGENGFQSTVNQGPNVFSHFISPGVDVMITIFCDFS
jgi:hypothetical protein